MPNRLDAHQLGLRLRRLRQERAWSVSGTASAAGLSTRYVTEMEAGRANPTVGALDQLAEAYGLALADVLPRPVAAGPRAAVERILDRRSHEELETIAHDLELRFGRRRRQVIALIGPRGSGKSALGSMLAERLEIPFVELDDLVEARAGMRLASLFSNYGEAYYRQLEQRCLSQLLVEDRPLVLATGGSVVEHLESYDLLLRSAVTVWLRASAETL